MAPPPDMYRGVSNPRWTPTKKELREHAINNLVLFITNDGDMYRRYLVPTYETNLKRMARGKYSKAKAQKAFEQIVEAGGRKYAREFGVSTHAVYRNQKSKVKPAAAKELRQLFEAEAPYM
jgi:hypothetical protein